MLSTAALGGPVREGFQVVAILPGEVEEFFGVEVGGVWTEKGFEAPLNVRAFPGTKAVAAGGEPIELKDVPHELSGP